jgi:hypothetical protein
MKLKEWIKKVWEYIKNLYAQLVDKTRQYVPIAINVVEGVKSVMDSPVDDVVLGIIKVAIKGQADDVIIDKVQAVVKE